MEGRAIARPNISPDALPLSVTLPLQWRAEQSLGQTPPRAQDHRGGQLPFNGGPSNRSAKPGALIDEAPDAYNLQWRAEQSLGQTGSRVHRGHRGHRPFNGGPSNRSAKLDAAITQKTLTIDLQWRAEQSLGQTQVRRHPLGCPRDPFNGGPSNRSAKLHSTNPFDPATASPSMEGRAIARPNDRAGCTGVGGFYILQWRAEQSLGQTPIVRLCVRPPL